MKIAFITFITPYKENKRGPSGHPYHLLIDRDKNLEVTIFSYNNNNLTKEEIQNVEKELNVQIVLLKNNFLFNLIFALRFYLLRVFLKYPIAYYQTLSKKNIQTILSYQPDAIWGYCAELEACLKPFKHLPCLLTLPDSVSLYYYRRLNEPFSFNNSLSFWKDCLMYKKYLRMEQNYEYSSHHFYHLVGKQDINNILKSNPNINAFFIHHPTYYIENPHRQIKFSTPKIKLLLAGQYNYYMKQAADELIQALSNNTSLSQYYQITFLGKGWEMSANQLQKVGFDIHHISFAPDYIEEICKHDIQITPIAIGTGTKGKVLDAIANGLLVIGTPYALENIEVKHQDSCMIYQHAQEAIAILSHIPNHITLYEDMAKKGRNLILEFHNKKKCAKELFSYIEN